MAFDTTAAAGVLKEFYLPAVREQINNKVMILEQIERGAEHVEGAEWVASLHVSRNSGVGARGENDTSPTAGAQGYVQQKGPVREQRGRIQVSGKAIKALASDKGSFVRTVESETKQVTNDLRRDVNRQCFGTADGVIATCGTTTTSATVVLAAATPSNQLRQLEVGMVVDIGTVASPTTIASARTITATAPTASPPTITISGATISTTSSHFVFRQGAGGNNPQLELTGLQAIVKASASLFGVDPATYPVWVSSVFGNSGTKRPINDALLQQVMDDVSLKSAGPDTEDYLWVASYGVFRQYGNYLSTMKRAPNTIDLKGGYKGLDITSGGGTTAITRERDCPDSTAFYLDLDELEQPEMSDWEFMDEDGAVLSRVANSHAYEATLYKFHELMTTARNAHGQLQDISE